MSKQTQTSVWSRIAAVVMALAVAVPAQIAQAADVDLTQRLLLRNEIFKVTQDVRPFMYDEATINRLGAWLNHYKITDYVVDCQFNLRAFFRSAKIIGPLCYHLRQDDPTRRAKYFSFVKRYILEVEAALRELAEDPRYSAAERSKAAGWAALFNENRDDAIKQCFKRALDTNYPADGTFSFSPFSQVGSCLNQSLPKAGNVVYFAVNLAKEFPDHPGHAVSETGWIGGNKITYWPNTDTSVELAGKLAEIHGQMKQHYPLEGAGSYEAMLQRSPDQTFTREQGFLPIDEHPVWAQEGGLFPGILATLKEAQKTIFVDMFFIGSSMGAAFAKFLVDRAESGVKVLVMRDNYNHFGHAPEMMPVYNFLRAYSYKNPEKMVVAPSYIKGHRTGLPKIMDEVLTDDFLQKTGLEKHLKLYGRAMSDHSKVYVIDGATEHPIAIIGSKNLTDASGAVNYDEVMRIDGPIAAEIQDGFYFDMAYALRLELDKPFLTHLASKGWSKASFQQGQSVDEMTANVLRPFDLLSRDKAMKPKAGVRVSVPSAGTAVGRSGYNNVDSTRTSTVDQYVQMALRAKRSIYIKDQFMFDRNVSLAVARALKRNPQLDVRMILEPQPAGSPKDMPNLLYLDVLAAAGAKIKFKRMPEMTGPIGIEYHMKTMSSDGQSLISGSANKDQTTMYGAFREQQLDVFDVDGTKVHDDAFMAEWNDDAQTRPFGGFDFAVPYGLKGANGQPLTSAQFIGLTRNLVSILFDAQVR